MAALLLVLGVAVVSTWYDRASTTDWDDTLWIGVFPLSAERDAVSDEYIARLTTASFTDIEQFLGGEARDYGINLQRPVRVDLYPQLDETPPTLAPGSNLLQRMWWSIRLRLYARRATRAADRPPPQIRLFVLYHDPQHRRSVPHSVGLQKGLVGVVHAYADGEMNGANNVVIAHEILHTLGASDKYDPGTLAPLYPSGFAEPDRDPRYPQSFAEVMAGRYAVDENTFEMPESLRAVVVGPETALEIGWITQNDYDSP